MSKESEVRQVLTELSIQDVVELRTIQMETIKHIMKENIHYGKIPGTPKPSLWQPGAQILDKLHGYSPTFDLLDKIEDWDKGFFAFRYRARLIRQRDDVIMGEGVGSCNSKEKKYRIAVYHGEDEGMPVDPRDNVNTYEKMAQKRAHISASLNATGLSDIFTQDVEDMIDQFIPGVREASEKKEQSAEKEQSTDQEHLCPIHNVPFTEKKGKYGAFWSHTLDDGSYCNEKKVKEERKEERKVVPKKEVNKEGNNNAELAESLSDAEIEPLTETPSELTDLSWEVIRPTIRKFIDEKKQGWSNTDVILSKLQPLGITVKTNIKLAYESLSESGKLKFLWMVKEASKP